MALPQLIERMKSVSILVVGDLMLDRFVQGEVTRLSPESPVPILDIRHEHLMLGGAGNVLANLRGLNVQADLVAVIGADGPGATVRDLVTRLGGDQDGLLESASRSTTVKTRFVAGHQQLLRVDAETRTPLAGAEETVLLGLIATRLPHCRAVILSDYGKGALTERVLRETIAQARRAGLPVLVDPKGSDYARYRGATMVTPNRRELAEATAGMPTVSNADIEAACRALIAQSGIETVVATRSQDGLSVIDDKTAPLHLAARALEVFDVSGAGDTVIATLAAALAAGAALPEAAGLANRAGGIVVAKAGTAAIQADELASSEMPGPLYEPGAALAQMRAWQAQGLKVGFTNGCFDILHAGHVEYLGEARQHCDRLVVGLNRDSSVRLLKGPTRPVNDEAARAVVLGGLASVAMVVPFGAAEAGQDNTPCALIEMLKPDIFFKGGDYTVDKLPEAAVVNAYGGEVRIMGLSAGKSTTGLIDRIRA